jgi:hypothetical protein
MHLRNTNGTFRILNNASTNIFNIDQAGTTTVSGNLKVGPFYFDGNDDSWLRLRTADGGAYRDFAVNQLWTGGNATVSGNLSVGPFYFDGNNDSWLRLRTADEGAMRDFAVNQLWTGSNVTVSGSVSAAGDVCGAGKCLSSVSNSWPAGNYCIMMTLSVFEYNGYNCQPGFYPVGSNITAGGGAESVILCCK